MSSTSIACLGLSHHSAPVELRERLACSLADLNDVIGSDSTLVSDEQKIKELVVISTCNRMEIYAGVDGESFATRAILADYLAMAQGIDLREFDDHLYYLTDNVAVEHLFSVAAGLESLILGEPQILGQVTDAYMSAVEAKTIGPLLTDLFRAAIRVGKRARTETNLSSNPASISSIAIAKAQQIVGDLAQRQPLVVGMGEMGRLAMKSLKSRGVQQIAVANRTKERAETFAEGCGGNAYTMAELADALAEADVVISATAAPHIVIHPEMVQEAMAHRADRALVLVDVAVPRDVDPAVADIPGVHLFDVDDLQGSLDEALAARQREVPKVREIIRQEATAFEALLRQMSIKPLIADFRQRAEEIRQREIQRALRYLGNADPQTVEQIQLFSRSLVNKLLHEPTVRLKEKATNGESAAAAEALRDLFLLDSAQDSPWHE